MKTKFTDISVLLFVGSLLLVGCAHTPLKMIRASDLTQSDLDKYKVLVIEEFSPATTKIEPDQLVQGLANSVAYILRNNYPGLFDEIVVVTSKDKATVTGNVMDVKGTITKYERGNRFLRGLLIGLSSSSIDIEIVLSDFETGKVLAEGKVGRYYNMGGYAGMSYGIEDMMSDTAKEVAKEVWRLKTGQAKKK